MTPSSQNAELLAQSLSTFLDGLFGYAMVLSRDRSVAEDLVQETCVRAIQAGDKLLPDSNIKGWLFTILRNIWLNQIRKQRTTPKIVDLDADPNGGDVAVEPSKDPHAAYVDKVERDLVREAIQKLPDDFREIILLREYEDLSYQEIATILGCPAGTVMSRLGRARSRLRMLLGDQLRAPERREKGAAE